MGQVLCFVVMCVLWRSVILNAQPLLSTDSQDVQRWTLPSGATSFRLKEPRREDREEWRASAIDQDLIDLNLISIPGVLWDKEASRCVFPVLDALSQPYEIMLKRYPPAGMRPPFRAWAYAGRDLVTLRESQRIETRLHPPLRRKYEQNNSSFGIVLPKVSVGAARRILGEGILPPPAAAEHDEYPTFWEEVLGSSQPVIIAEGYKKALALISAGYAAIGLPGVCRTVAEVSAREGSVTITPDIAILAMKKVRPFHVVFDTDENTAVRTLVYSTAAFLAEFLESQGHPTRVVVLPGGAAKGVDDLILQNGRSEFRKLLESAISPGRFRAEYAEVESLPNLLRMGLYDWCFSFEKGPGIAISETEEMLLGRTH